MSVMRIYNAVENAEMLKKYFPEYDGITFTISDKKKRIICNCGKVIPLESNHLTTQCDCGGHNYYNLGCERLCYTTNGRMGVVKVSDVQKSVDADGNQSAFVSSLVLMVKEKKLMRFEEEEVVIATLSSDGILKFPESKLFPRNRSIYSYGGLALPCSNVTKVFDNFEEQMELAEMLSIRDFPEYWENISEIFKNPNAVEVARTYPQLFAKAFESINDPSVITSFEELCNVVGIPLVLKDFWTVYTGRGSYNLEHNLYKLLDFKKTHPELGTQLERLVQRGIIAPEICAEMHDLYAVTNEIIQGRRTSIDYRFSYRAKRFIDSLNISAELMELFGNFVRDNIVEYSTNIFEKFIERYHWCEENGITPTDFTLSSKEYYKNLNERKGGKPKFHEEILKNPLEAVKYY